MRGDDEREVLDALSKREVREEPPHDGDYFRGLLKVTREAQRSIEADIATLERTLATRRSQLVVAERQRRDAIVRSRDLLTRREVGGLLKVSEATVSKIIAHELRNRGMGARL